MKKIVITIIILLIVEQIYAQPPKSKIHFSSINSIGTIIGENGGSTTVQTINGIKSPGNWFFGAGAGYDPYQVKSIPAFIDIRKYFFKTSWQPFVYADVGWNINLHGQNYPKESYIFQNSGYYDWGVGFSNSISKTAKFFISAGYNIKQFKYKTEIYQPGPSGIATFTYSGFNFNFNRWAIKLGLEL